MWCYHHNQLLNYKDMSPAMELSVVGTFAVASGCVVTTLYRTWR